MKRVIRICLALLLIPVIWATGHVVFDLARPDGNVNPNFFQASSVRAFLLGAGAWLLWWWFLPKPLFLYTFAHEISHAIFILLFGGRISEIKIGHGQGHVVSNRSNFLISLCPYFFPFYSALLLLAGLFIKNPGPIFHGTLGLTWMFHITFTIWAIRQRQSDLAKEGNLFSLKFILLVNIFLVLLAIVWVSPSISFSDALAEVFRHLKEIFSSIPQFFATLTNEQGLFTNQQGLFVNQPC